MNHFLIKQNNFTKLKQNVLDHRILLIILLITLLANAIRFFQLGDHSFWYDEAASVQNVQRILDYPQDDPWGPLSFTKRERVPPLYFLLLVPFYLIKNSEWSLRLLSVIFGVGSIPLMYLLGKHLVNKSVGIISASLLVVSPFHIYYSQELRPYSLFLFFALGAYVCFIRTLNNPRLIYYILGVLSVVLGIYTHTYMVLVLVTLDIFFVIHWNRNRKHLLPWVFSHLAILILCLPEIYILFTHIQRGNINLVDSIPGYRTIASTIYIFTFGRFFFPNFPNIFALILQGIIYAIAVVIGLRYIVWKNSNQTFQDRYFLIASSAIYLIMFIISITFIPLFDEARVHYLIFLLPAFILLIAMGFSALQNRILKTILIIFALGLSLFSSYPYFFQWDLVGRGNFREAAAVVEENSEGVIRIYHTDDRSRPSIDYYLDGETEQILIDADFNPAENDEDQFWLVIFEPSNAVNFFLSSTRLQNNDLPNQPQPNDKCLNSLRNVDYEIIDAVTYSGKNELTLCQFKRIDP